MKLLDGKDTQFRWYTLEERPLEVGDFVVADFAQWVPRRCAGIVLYEDEFQVFGRDAITRDTQRIERYKFVKTHE